MEKGKGKRQNRTLTERETDILFVLTTLEEIPEKTEILEELELARQEEKKRGRSCYRENIVKQELERLQKRYYVSKSLEITGKGRHFLKNTTGKKERQKLSLNWTEILAVVRQSGK